MRLRPWLIPALLLSMAPPGHAQRALFDSHLHFTAEHAARYSEQQILAILDANAVTRALVTSVPPRRVLALHKVAPQRILPLLGVYRSAADKTRWWRDTNLPAWLEQELGQGGWRGIGELHLFAEQRHSPVFLRVVELAADHRLPLLMHCDPAVIDALFTHRPDARVIWAHAGAYPYPPLLRDYLARYPNLWLDLSVRDERIAPDGVLDGAWEDLLLEFPDRFLVGVDTYRSERWGDYRRVATQIRRWLAQLPDDVAGQIAHGNAAALFSDTAGPAQMPNQATTP